MAAQPLPNEPTAPPVKLVEELAIHAPTPLRKVVLFGFLGVIAGIIGYAAYEWFIYSATHITTNNAYLEGEMWPVHSRVMGFIKDIPVEESGHVKKGDPILVLDDADLQIELQYKRARFDKAESDVKRARALNRSSLVSQADYETAQATLASVKADLDGTLLKLKYTQLAAPADGYIGKISMHAGQFVQPGQNVMLLVSTDKLWVQANYKETQVTKIKIGSKAKIIFDAYPDTTFDGEVSGVFPSSGASMSLIPPENATGNFTKIVQRIPVKINIVPKLGYALRPGMSVVSTVLVE